MEPEEPKSLVFRFSDPRQRRIYEELNEVVGPGPAAFFHDACWLMANPETLETTAHLVAHLLRELESAIRAVFKPVAEGALPGANGSSSQKEEIKLILAALNIEEGTPEAEAWFDLADRLHGLAHRRGLDAPRSTKEINLLWNQSQGLLDILVRALRKRFLAWIRDLDRLLEKSQPKKEDINRLVQEIPNNRVVRQYFFDRLKSSEWLEPLRAKGFFRNPPQPEHDEEEGTIHCPPWPEGRYLARRARHRPELVAKIIQDMDNTDNAAVHFNLVEALLTMPADVTVSIIEKAKTWAGSPYLLSPEKLGRLISHLAKGGKIEEAMEIARVLLDILPDPKQQVDEPHHLSPKPHARFDTWDYEQILKKHYPDLVREAGLPALALLCDLLDKAIQLSRCGNYQGLKDYFWRPAIEDHQQNLRHTTTIKDVLISGISDGAELVVHSGNATVEKVVNTLELRNRNIFRRIALHVIRMFPDQAQGLAAARLTDRSLFEDVGLQHEYVLLLQDNFQRLTLEEQTRILGWIEDGPEVDEWKQRRKNKTKRQPSEEEVARYRETWQRDWMARIGRDNLPEKWKKWYRNLCEKYGEPDHPEFPVYLKMVRRPTSPKTTDDFKAMSVAEIVALLRTWEPPENMFREPSPEGLGRVLSSVVAEDPGRFAIRAPVFQGLDPTYVRAVVSGLGDAVKQGRAFDWEPVLDLCDWVLSQPREIQGRQVRETDADPDWGWTRKAIADLLSAGFEDRRNGIPIGLRQRVWAILKPLTDDPDPTPEHEQRYGGSNMNPATLSINTTRGEAMHSVIRYALWVRRHLEKEPDAEERFAKGFSEMPEVREVLAAHLDPALEPSLTIRAVYGQWFPWLVLLDTQWARENAVRIFPLGEQEQAYFEAAWNTYVMFCRPYDNVFDVLRDQYRHAVRRIGFHESGIRYPSEPENMLSEDLMIFYYRGKLELGDPLLTTFWKKGADALRAHALDFLGSTLQRMSDPIPNEVSDRLIRLWEARLSAAKEVSANHEKEMAAFGWWFVSGKFDAEWVIAQLAEALQIARKAEPDYMVVEKLAEIVETYPLEVIKCLKVIVEGDRKGWGIYRWSKYARHIVRVALQDATAKQEAENFIHYLGSYGYLNFRDLLE